MPRDSNGRYTLPPGTYGQPNTTIESARYNRFVDDIAQDMNTPRPITAGGTGASSAAGAITNLGGVSTDYINSLLRGIVMHFPISSPPDGWLICDGSAVSRAAYSELFDLIGTSYGAGNGSSTFNLPDLRGEFIRGADLGRGVDTGRQVGSTQSDDVKPPTHTGTTNSTGAHTHTYSIVTIGGGVNFASGGTYAIELTSDSTGSGGTHSHTLTTNASGGTETRPRNVALVPCIKV